MFKIKPILILCALAISFATPNAVSAEDTPVDIIPASSISEGNAYEPTDSASHPPVRLTPDKSELIRLDKKAGTIIIGNPEHLNVLADSAQTLILVPRMPGATHMTVLDQQGEVLMSRHVIIASPQKKYVRIRRSCASSKDECKDTQVYYCPDMCHEIQIVREESEANDSPFDALEELVEGSGNEEVDEEATEE